MFAHPKEAAEVGAKELRTTLFYALRALEDTASMDIMSRDLTVVPASLQRVFRNMQEDGVIGRDVPFDTTRFVDDSYLKESQR